MTPLDKIKRSIRASKKLVFLRSDFARFGQYRQISRVLRALENDGVLRRAGHGIYIKPGQPADIRGLIDQVRARLGPGKRVRRIVTLGDVTVQLGLKSGRRNAQSVLDEKKLARARELVRRIDLATIRKKSLANLDRWEAQGVWCSADDEWRVLMREGTDAEVVTAMTAEDEQSNRLRQSPPYVGLLSGREKYEG
jgi:hypothetical protein